MKTLKIDFSPMKNKQDTPKVGVGVIIRKNGKILMGERTGSHGANKWSLPGGHVDMGEDPAVTCMREVLEETGIFIDGANKAAFSHTVFEEEGLHYVTLFYEAEWNEKQEPVNIEPDKAKEWAWIDPFDLPENVFGALLEPDIISVLRGNVNITNLCNYCSRWWANEKVCTYDDGVDCECEVLLSLGIMNLNGLTPKDWNPSYKWGRTLENFMDAPYGTS